jgi:hypothetical protein
VNGGVVHTEIAKKIYFRQQYEQVSMRETQLNKLLSEEKARNRIQVCVFENKKSTDFLAT